MHAALKEQIAGLERRLWLEGSEAFDKIMAPECFMVFPKSDVVMRDLKSWQGFSLPPKTLGLTR